MSNVVSQVADDAIGRWARSYLTQVLAEVAVVDAEGLNDYSPFAEMGIDSFRVLKIIKRLEADFGSLPKTLLFENVNIDELAQYFAAQHAAAAGALMGVSTVELDVTPATAGTPRASTPSSNPDAPAAVAAPAEVVRDALLPQGPILLPEEEARSHSGLNETVARIFDRYKNEAGASRGARTIAPNLFIGSCRRGFFNYARCKQIILAYAYTGPDDAFDTIAGELEAHCTSRGLQLNIFSDRVLSAIGGMPFSATPFGLLQRIIALPEFSLEGGAMRRLRYQVSKFAKAGMARTEEYRLGGSAEVERSISHLIERWCANKPMVNPLIHIVRQEILSQTLDAKHRLFLTYLDDILQNVVLISPLGPDYGGYLMDLEFYDSTMALGGLEFAITQIVEQLVREGCELLSMGGTYGCRVETCTEADPDISRVLDDLQSQGIFDDQGNMQFKNKFRPENRSIYLCRRTDSGPAENVVDIIMMIADPQAMQTSDAENFSLRADAAEAVSADVACQAGSVPGPSRSGVRGQRLANREGSTLEGGTREELLASAGYNPANIAAEQVAFDLRTDSWAQLRLPAIAMRMQHLRAQLQAPVPVDQALRTLFPFTHFHLASSGRTAEEALYASLDRKGKVIQNLLFPTGLFHQIDNGFDPVELPCPEALDPKSAEIFKGDIDLSEVRRRLKDDPGSIALACLEASNNATGGLPVSMGNVRELRSLLAGHRIPLVLDATRILDNAHFIVAHEPGFAGRQVWEVAREMLGLADIVTCSLGKNFCVDRGGLIAVNDSALFDELDKTMTQRGGRLDAIDRKIVALAVQDRRRIEAHVSRRIETTRLLGEALKESGIPLSGPTGGHALLIDVRRIPAFQDLDQPAMSFVAWLYLNTGIRAGVHSVGMQKGTAINDLVRLAIPHGLTAGDVEQLAECLAAQFNLLQNIPELATLAGASVGPDPHARFELRAIRNPSPLAAVASKQELAIGVPVPAPCVVELKEPSPVRAPSVQLDAANGDARGGASGYRQRDIAIIGMAGRYPKARTLDQLWRNLAQGRDCVDEISADRLALRPVGSYPKNYRGGFIDDVDRFDSLFFNVSPRDAELMDPQERLFLEVAWEALEDAGYNPDALAAAGATRDVGVYVGAVWTTYQLYGVEGQHAGRDVSPNSFLWSIANHVSYCLNLSGPSMTVDTACSSSLTALYLACEAIYKGECSSAIVGGVNLDLHPGKLAINLVGGALSPDGVCRSFGKGANGYVAGEGVGAVLIKPLEDAVRDGDAIHGVIKGIAVNHGARSNGYAVPNPRAQADVVASALARAGIEAHSLSYIETHGTGTELGDPVEIRALTSAFDKAGAAPQSCAIGSIKSNIGHLEAAAGIVSVCKVLLQMRHGQLAPSLHSRETNDFIDFKNSPFYVVQDPQPWHGGMSGFQKLPLRAGVSSFGAGGSNAHVILESYVPGPRASTAGVDHVFPLSARSEEQLREQARQLKNHLTADRFVAGSRAEHEPADVARTLQLGRNAHEHRAAIVAADIPELLVRLDRVVSGEANENVAIGSTRNSASLAKLLNAQEQDQFTRLVAGGGDHRRLARLWADGVFSRWNGAEAEAVGSRVHLPTYPFADRRHWIHDSAAQGKRTGGQDALHMLVDSNVSTFDRQIFKKRFHDGDFFIHDHLVSEIPTLPGVAYLELARKAGELAAGRPVRRIRNMLWLSPISIRDGVAQDVLIELKPNGAAVHFEVFSLGEDDSRKIHAQGQLLFTPSGNADEQLDLGSIRARTDRVIEGSGVYPQLDEAGLRLGPSFQVLQDVYANDTETLGHLVLAPDRRADLGALALHPALVDGALQTGVASQLSSENAEMAVPYSIGEVEILRPLPAECWSHVTVLSDNKAGGSKVRRANVTITDAEGRVLVQLRETIGVPLTDVHKAGEGAQDAPEALCFVPGWKAAQLDGATSALDGVTLWFDRDRDRAGWAAARMRSLGGTGELVVVEPATEFAFDGDFRIDPTEAEHFIRLVQQVEQGGRAVRRVCWAWPLSEDANASSEDRLQHGVFALMSLAQALTARKRAEKLQIVYAFRSDSDGVAGEHEAVAGFGRALRLEDPKLQVKTLELRGEAAGGDPLIDAVLRECGADGGDADAVRREGSERLVRTVQAAPQGGEQPSTLLREAGVYLITGGAGGLGLLFAEHLARTCAAKLVLTGRSQPSPEILGRLADLEKLGAEVLYLAADVSDSAALEPALAEARGRFGALHGVIHSAGVLRDSYLRNKSVADMQAVLAPKVAGTIALDAATSADPLDFFVLFSSMSAVGGNPGQTDYCFANGFMDSFAARRENQRATGARAGRTLSINWSLWAEGGMRLDPQSEQLFRKTTGITPLSTQAGLAAFARALGGAEPQMIVVQGDRERIETSLGLRAPPAKAAAPAANRTPAKVGDAEGDEQALAIVLLKELSQIVLDHLKLAPDDLETDKILLDLGFDSIGLATFANALNDRLGLEITPILFFDYPSIDEIVRHLASEHRSTLSHLIAGEAPAARLAEPLPGGAEPVMFHGKSWNPDAVALVSAESASPATAPSSARDDRIAIVGIGGSMPQSADLIEFWENLREGRDLITVIPPDRWDWEEHFGDPLREPDKTNSKWGGFMSEVDKFDPLFFGISPLEAQMMDPQQRLFLQNVWEAVEDSGHKLADLAGTRTGLFVGVATSDYVNIINRQKIGISAYTASGNSHAMLANRVSYLLNLRGPSAPIDTACSSSLIALHRAVETIQSGNCDMAIVGGVQVMLTPAAHVSFSMAGMLSPDGRCKAFDKSANGYVRGEGSGAILIKRLADAEADGDHIYAVVRSTAENHGGRVTTLTAPNAAAQAELLVHAYSSAGIDPATVGFIECHGTGTGLGDPIEVQALNRAFGQLYERQGKPLPAEPHCGLSSVKTNIGHLETAAGIASLLTTCLAIKHRQIPANLHLEEVNPYISLKGTPFYIADHTTQWDAPLDEDGRELPRRAGISSFGFGGANAHIVLEEYVRAAPVLPGTDGPRLVVLSARNRDRLHAYAAKLLAHLDREPVDLARLCYTLQVGRDAFAERLAFVVDGEESLREGLSAYLAGSITSAMRTGSSRKQAADAPNAAQVREWIEAGNLVRIAEAWVSGAEVDWALLYPEGTPLRVSLPTYPFARERYWIPESEGGEEGAIEAGAGAPRLHPLVHRNSSTLQEQKYVSHLVGDESFLRDHVVEGRKILPGVAYIEMARAAGTLAAGSDVRSVRKLVWMAPLVVESGGADVEIQLTPRRDEIEFRVTSKSDGKLVTHCTGFLGFTEDARSVRRIDLGSVRARAKSQVLDRPTLYRYFESLGLTLGATFRMVDRIWANETEALAELHVPAEAASEIDRYGLHPGAMDGALHAAIGLMKSGDVDPPLSLPFAVGEVQIFGSLKDVRHSYASWADRDGKDDPNHWKVDFLLLDAEGEVLVSIRNFASKPLHRGQSVMLQPALAAPTPEASVQAPTAATVDASGGLWSLVPGWSPMPRGAAADLPLDSRILLLGGDPAALAWLRASYPAAAAFPLDTDPDVAALAARLQVAEFDHLVWIAPDVSSREPAQEAIAAQEDGVLAAFRLTKALLAAGQGGRNLQWTLVTKRARPVRDGDGTDPSHASLVGYVSCLAKEYPHWSLRLVDVETIETIAAEACLTLPWSAAKDGYVHRQGEWLYQDLSVLTPPSVVRTSFRQGGVYVVIGGAGGIGHLWSRHLVEVYDAQLVWIGRRALDASIERKLDEIAEIGRRPLYLSADATHAAALAQARDQILSTHPRIHGVVHSALILRDQSVAQMNEADFLASLAAKVDVSVNLDLVFGDLDLDFLLFFSSIIALRGSPGQSNYAAGSTFLDAFAQTLRARRTYPVKVINWGYWGDVGVVADSSYRKAMEQKSVGSIQPAEGWAQIELLLGSNISQIAVLKAVGPQASAGFAGLDRVLLTSGETAPVLAAVSADWVEASQEHLDRLGDELPSPEQDRLVAEIVAATLRDRGLLDGAPSRALDERYARWLDGSRSYLRQSGWIDEAGGAAQPIRTLETLWQLWSERRPDWIGARPHHASQTTLLETCLRNLPEVLSGERAATEILFPKSSFELVEGVYRGSPLADHFNAVLSATLTACVARWLEADPARKIRILEIGAGTGGTTAGLLPELAQFGDSIAEYCFTDLSKAFLLHATKTFQTQHPALTTALFDASKPLAGQGIEAGRYDLVVAANVLHATPEIRATLRNAKAALGRDGVLLLNEISAWSAFSHLTFGLLDGWWCYEDGDVRLAHAPGIAPQLWQHLLSTEGFDPIFFPASGAHVFGQQIVVAASDGIIRQSPAAATAQGVHRAPPSPAARLQSNTDERPVEVREEAGKAMDYEQVRSAVAGKLSEALHLDMNRIIDDEPFAEYGVDSIVGVNLVRMIGDALEIDLDPTVLFEHVTVGQLSEHIFTAFRTQLTARHGASATAVTATSSSGGTESPGWRQSEVQQHRFAAPAKFAPSARPQPFADESIAIVGMSGRFAESETLDEFWHNLESGRDLVSQVTRWSPEESALASTRDGAYCSQGSFVGSAALFDPAFFRISPAEALCMDPQQRLFLEEAWKALEDAGYANKERREKRCGVFVGCGGSKYDTLLGDEPPAHTFWGNSEAVLPARIAYYLDLHGPAMAVNTACSSSLVTIHLACQSLRLGETDMGLAGGVFLQPTPGFYQVANRAGMLSPQGRCFAFDARADGFVPGEGVGVVVLKRLSDAQRDGDHIHGVIIGSAVNQDGASNGIIAPNAAAQERLECDLYDRFSIDPSSITMLEAHGTGTILGDAIEFGAITKAFRKYTDRKRFCAIGSVKSNIGHAATAAGVASVIKMLLTMRHRKIPASLHFTSPNPAIDLDASPFYVPTRAEAWPDADGIPRRAAASSFGFSGTNAHMVVEEAPEHAPRRADHPAYLIALSARTEAQLATMARNLALSIEASPALQLGDVSYTLLVGRSHLPARLALVVRDRAELLEKLNRWVERGSAQGVSTGVVDEEAGRPRASLSKFGLFCIDEYRRADAGEALEHLGTLADLFLQGCSLDYDGVFAPGEVGRVPLPTYPFARERFWIDAPVSPTRARTLVTPADWQAEPALAATFAGLAPQPRPVTGAAPHAVVEQWLQREVATQLRQAPELVPADLPFFDLGLSSLGVAEFIRAVNGAMGISIQPSTVFDHPTIRSLANWLAAAYPEEAQALGAETGEAPPAGEGEDLLRKIVAGGEHELAGLEKLTF